MTEQQAVPRLDIKHGWIGVDLDGTLAVYDGWVHAFEIGAPILQMVERIRDWLDQGREVRIVTARVTIDEEAKCLVTGRVYRTEELISHIQDYCEQYVRDDWRPVVTCQKDVHMLELWDDRCVAVEANTGKQLSPSRY